MDINDLFITFMNMQVVSEQHDVFCVFSPQ
jgi:hypothetical protein